MFHDYSNGTGLKQHEPDFDTWKNDHNSSSVYKPTVGLRSQTT